MPPSPSTPGPGPPADCFGPGHLLDLDKAAHVAGELVSEAYGLDLGDFRQWPVDLRHWPQLTAAERSGQGAFAQLFRYARAGAPGRGDFWRICLYDPAIMSAAGREGLGLHPLLCYILTHELVHVARFIRFIELFSLDKARREAEEALVHAETERLLAPLPIQGLARVRELYLSRSLPLDDDPSLGPFEAAESPS